MRRSWIAILTATLLGLGLGVAANALEPPAYTATSTLFLSVRASGPTSEAYRGNLFLTERTQSYTALVTSPTVLEDIAAVLGTPTATAKVSAEAVPGTALIEVSATDGSPDRAAETANAGATALADEIQRIETLGITPTDEGLPLYATVTEPAVAPTSPSSPNKALNLLLGFILGLGAGKWFAIGRDHFDTSVHSGKDLAKVTGLPNLATVPVDKSLRNESLGGLLSGPLADSFRAARTGLQYLDVDSPPRAIVITSATESEGKSTSSCGLALAFAQAGSRVLLVDADLRQSSLADRLGVPGTPGLTEVLVGRYPLDVAVTPLMRGRLAFLPAGTRPPNPSELLNSRRLASLVDTLKSTYDIVIIDAPPLLPVTDAALLAALADGAVLVVRCRKTTAKQIKEATATIRKVSARMLGTVATFAPHHEARSASGQRTSILGPVARDSERSS